MTRSSKKRIARHLGSELVPAKKTPVASRHVPSRLLPKFSTTDIAPFKSFNEQSPQERLERFQRQGVVAHEIDARFSDSEQDRILAKIAAMHAAMLPMRATKNQALPLLEEVLNGFYSLLVGTRPACFEPVSFAPGTAKNSVERIIGIAEIVAVFAAECSLVSTRTGAAEKVIDDLTKALGAACMNALFNIHEPEHRTAKQIRESQCRSLKRYQEKLAGGETFGIRIDGIPDRDIQHYQLLKRLRTDIEKEPEFLREYYCKKHFQSAVARLKKAVIIRG